MIKKSSSSTIRTPRATSAVHSPQHVLVIPDGNRRWAKKRGLKAFFGHQTAVNSLEKILDRARELHIPYFTFWGMSLDNFTKRSPEEVAWLLGLFKKEFSRLTDDPKTKGHGIRVRVIGKWNELFPEDVRDVITTCIDSTKDHADFNLTFLLAYSGKDEMADAVRKIAAEAVREPHKEISESAIKRHLWTKDLPPVDLVIRTGGEPHLSGGLMMWEVADAQLYFTETLYPDFSPEEFSRAVTQCAATERRFGA